MFTDALLGRKLPLVQESQVKPLVITFLGPPGAGKGTLAVPLSEQLQIPHISTGALFRQLIRTETPLGQTAAKYIHQGMLIPDELAIEVLLDRTAQADCEKGYILDGFPRTLAQAERFKKHLPPLRFITFNLDVPESILIERISGRLVCKYCARSFHKTGNPPRQLHICDSCQGPLYTREDDSEPVLRRRLEIYHAQTAPLLAFYRETLITLDGSQPKEAIFEQLLHEINR